MVLLANTNPVALKPALMAVTASLMTVIQSPGNNGDHQPKVMWLHGNNAANLALVMITDPVTIMDPVITMDLVTIMDLATRVVLPLGLRRTNTKVNPKPVTTITDLKVVMLLLVLPQVLLLGSNRPLLADSSLPMVVDTVDTVDMRLTLLAWALLVLPLLVWARLPLLPLLVWLQCTLELLAALLLRPPLAMPRLRRLQATCLPHPHLPSDDLASRRKSNFDSNRFSMREEICYGGFERQFNQD